MEVVLSERGWIVNRTGILREDATMVTTRGCKGLTFNKFSRPVLDKLTILSDYFIFLILIETLKTASMCDEISFKITVI